jgi:hypothetical protein
MTSPDAAGSVKVGRLGPVDCRLVLAETTVRWGDAISGELVLESSRRFRISRAMLECLGERDLLRERWLEPDRRIFAPFQIPLRWGGSMGRIDVAAYAWSGWRTLVLKDFVHAAPPKACAQLAAELAEWIGFEITTWSGTTPLSVTLRSPERGRLKTAKLSFFPAPGGFSAQVQATLAGGHLAAFRISPLPVALFRQQLREIATSLRALQEPGNLPLPATSPAVDPTALPLPGDEPR